MIILIPPSLHLSSLFDLVWGLYLWRKETSAWTGLAMDLFRRRNGKVHWGPHAKPQRGVAASQIWCFDKSSVNLWLNLSGGACAGSKLFLRGGLRMRLSERLVIWHPLPGRQLLWVRKTNHPCCSWSIVFSNSPPLCVDVSSLETWIVFVDGACEGSEKLIGLYIIFMCCFRRFHRWRKSRCLWWLDCVHCVPEWNFLERHLALGGREGIIGPIGVDWWDPDFCFGKRSATS